MLMIDSIEFDIRYKFSDVRAEVPCVANDKQTTKSIANRNIKLSLWLVRKYLSLLDEEKLAELVGNYAILYDKSFS